MPAFLAAEAGGELGLGVLAAAGQVDPDGRPDAVILAPHA
jgi:hypothetical protein